MTVYCRFSPKPLLSSVSGCRVCLSVFCLWLKRYILYYIIFTGISSALPWDSWADVISPPREPGDASPPPYPSVDLRSDPSCTTTMNNWDSNSVCFLWMQCTIRDLRQYTWEGCKRFYRIYAGGESGQGHWRSQGHRWAAWYLVMIHPFLSLR